jgi:integrase
MTINIRFNATRRLKKNRSVRTVPVVDETAIEALRVRIAGKRLTDTVFPRYGRDGGPDSASAALSKWLIRIGLRDTRRIPKMTHSLRHAFKDGLRDAGVHRDVANMIQGHTTGDEASKYGSSELLSRKRGAAEKV